MRIKKLTKRQKKFCEEYVKTGNVVSSAVIAGYSDMYAKKANENIMHRPEINEYINILSEGIKPYVASNGEVKRFFTDILRDKEVSVKERFKAAQELMKLGCEEEKVKKEEDEHENPYKDLSKEDLLKIVDIYKKERDNES